MSYSPRRGPVPTGVRPEEAQEVAQRVPTRSAAATREIHLSTHFSLAGDVPQSYAAGLGKTGGFATVAAAGASNSPTKGGALPSPSSSSSSESSSSSAAGHPAGSSSGLDQQQKMYESHLLSRSEIRAKMQETHVQFRGIESPRTMNRATSASAGVPVEGSELDPKRPPSTFASNRTQKFLAGNFSLQEMEPADKSLYSRLPKPAPAFDAPAAAAVIAAAGVPLPGESKQLRQRGLASHFALT